MRVSGTLPPARDPRMDRREPVDDGWLLVMVPRDAARPVERVELRSRELAAWKLGAVVLGVGAVVALLLLAFTWPRAQAYGALASENLELKERLDDIDRKMGEVDRVLLRLRLYDAQLEWLGGPRGESGGPEPLPPELTANAPFLSDGPTGTGDEGFRAPPAWADEIALRADAFLDTARRVEPLIARLVGERVSLEALEAALPRDWPTRGFLTSGYGWRRNPFGGRKWQHHTGIDIGAERGRTIHAAGDGVVTVAGWSGGLGKAVFVDHGFGLTTVYGHCSKVDVAPGQRVRRGDRLAAMGSTGHSTGPHLHFEVRVDGHPVDPLDYVALPADAILPGTRRPR